MRTTRCAPGRDLVNKDLACPVIVNFYSGNIIPSPLMAAPHNPRPNEGSECDIKNSKSRPAINAASIGIPDTRLRLDLWNNLLMMPGLAERNCTSSEARLREHQKPGGSSRSPSHNFEDKHLPQLGE